MCMHARRHGVRGGGRNGGRVLEIREGDVPGMVVEQVEQGEAKKRSRVRKWPISIKYYECTFVNKITVQ